MTRVTLATANTPGAVAIVQLHGEAIADTLMQLTGRSYWPMRRAMLVDFAGIDEGLAIRINTQAAQLMPHGGPRVVQRLLEHLTQDLGCTYDPAPDTKTLYPEAHSRIVADVLDAVARAASPAAIDLLAQQTEQWASLLKHDGLTDAQRQRILERSHTLDQLIVPPTVVVAGPANVGKSTLTNALMGKAMSIVADLPGTTRDWVGGLVELDVRSENIAHRTSHIAHTAIAVNWLDTPGLRDSDDAIEQRAIQLARQQIEKADVLIAMCDPDQPWPDTNNLPRVPDLWVINKVDDAPLPAADAGTSPQHPLFISAEHQRNVDRLQSQVVHQLGLSDLLQEPWAFSPTLASWCESDDATILALYLGEVTRRV